MINKKDFLSFALISFGGLCIDFLVFHILFLLSNNIFLSNILGGFSAITFNYMLSRIILVKRKNDSFFSFISWLILMTFSIIIFSFMIEFINKYLTSHLLVKILVTPLSIIFNYLCWNIIRKFFLGNFK